MQKMWKKLKINQKILFPVIIVSIISGSISYLYFHNLYQETEINALVAKARTLITEAEAVREYTADQQKSGIFRNDLTDINDILYTVPIFSAMEVAKKKAKSLDMEFRVPKFQPRNAKNEPDQYEAEVLALLQQGNTEEYWQIDEATNKVRFFKPVKLTEECLICHGDPATSLEIWGNDRGLDVTGAKMEGWKAGEVHGAFEVMMSLEQVQAAVVEKSMLIASISALGIGLMTLIGFFVARNISRPIKELEAAANKVAQGDIAVSVNINTEDELGALGLSFNSMVDNIKAARHELLEEKRGVEKKVEDAVRESEEQKNYLSHNVNKMLSGMTKFSEGDLTVELNAEKEDEIGKLFRGFNKAVKNIKSLIERVYEAVDATASSSAQISSSTEQMAAGAQEQSSQTNEVAASVEQMSKTIIETTRNATVAADNARKAGNIAGDGGKVVEETVAGMQRISEVVLKSSDTVKKLGTRSSQIGEIIQVIDDIADQTNLLALNAAIEAARAGEQGRGFAVVADEVRKLAERTTKATKEIADMIKQIQLETDEAVKSMDEGTEEVQKGKNLAYKAGESLKEIISASMRVVDEINQVATASEEQSSTSELISRSIEMINNVTNENSAGITQVAKAAEDLNRLTDNLQNLISRFRIKTDKMGVEYSMN